ncbi:MAG: four helix bundle protein [Patescibacteria group bacterium]
MATGIENLKIYTLAKDLEIEVHIAVKNFPREERFRSIDQLKRSSASVANNIAEAYYKKSPKEKIRILRGIAISEAEETRTNLTRCAEKEFITPEAISGIIGRYIELRMAIFGYIKFLEQYKKDQVKNSSTH